MAATAQLMRRGELSPRIVELTSLQYRDPVALAKCMGELQQVAHVISPAAAFAALPPNVTITPIPVVIDATFDAKTGRGTDVYFQKSIHKSEKRGDDYVPLEVSLNANAIARILQSAGVSVTKSVRTDDGKDPHYCARTTHGKVRQFDGSWLDLKPGDVEIDLRDGSEQIGGWNAKDWPTIEAEAKAKREAAEKAKDRNAWKIKGEIGGWSADRVVSQRRFILPMAQTKSANRLGRGLGLKQIYTIAELTEKPFVIFRASWQHDMSNPDVAKMVTAAELGGLYLLFPQAQQHLGLPSPSTTLPQAVDGDSAGAEPQTETEEPSSSTTNAPAPAAATSNAPQGATEIDDIPDEPAEKPATRYVVSKISQLEDEYFIETKQGQTFVTNDKGTARTLNEARKSGAELEIDGEQEPAENGTPSPYLRIVECRPAPSTEKKY